MVENKGNVFGLVSKDQKEIRKNYFSYSTEPNDKPKKKLNKIHSNVNTGLILCKHKM